MNKYELLFLFESKIGPLMTNTNKTFLTSEVEVFLNNAQNGYFKALADVFERNEEVRRVLSPFTKSHSLTSVSPTGVTALSTTSKFYTLPSSVDGTLYRIVEEYVTTSTGARITSKPITHDQYHANIKNPFKNPYVDLVWRLDVDGYVEIISSGITPVNYIYRYLTSPQTIEFSTEDSTSLEFKDIDLENIVDIAIQLALNSLSVIKQGG